MNSEITIRPYATEDEAAFRYLAEKERSVSPYVHADMFIEVGLPE